MQTQTQTPFDPKTVNASLLRFARIGLGKDKVNVEEHGVILNTLSSLKFQIPQTISLILLPRASYKTTIASVAFPMYLLSHNPNLRVLIDSETYGLAKNILSEIKEHYTSPLSPLNTLGTPYGFASLKERDFVRWSESEIIIPSRTVPNKEASVTAAGIDGIKAGMHYDVIIADDLHSQNNTKNQTQIDQVIEHYRLLLSLLEPNGILIVIGTRWALEDAYTQIERDASTTLFIPATSTHPCNAQFDQNPTKVSLAQDSSSSSSSSSSNPTRLVYDNATNEAIESSEFYLNFPKTLPLEHLDRIEKRQGPYIYSAQYILRPVASRSQRFRPEWLRAIPDSFVVTPRHRVIGLLDPAFTTSEYSDYSGICVVASDHDRNAYVIHAEQQKLEPFSLIDHIFYLSKIYPITEWYIEEVAAQKVLRKFVEYLAAKEKKSIAILPVKSYGRKKEIRINALQPFFASYKIFLPSGQDNPLWDQLKKFPLCKHDDVLDALAYLPQVLYDGMRPLPAAPPAVKGIRMIDVTPYDIAQPSQHQETGIRPPTWRKSSTGNSYEV